MERILIIAEVGVNHNGSLENAIKLVDGAYDAGADIVKFQSFFPNELVTSFAEKANYQIKQTGKRSGQLEMLNELFLSVEDFKTIKNHCETKGIEFLTTTFGSKSNLLIKELGLKRIKIPSGEITNYPYLKQVAANNLPTIVSTGMATTDEIKSAIDVLIYEGLQRNNISLLYCVSEYPTPLSAVDLNVINTLRNQFNVNVGFSDHTQGKIATLAAASIGANIIEKHITLDVSLPGPDHAASMDINDFSELVDDIRDIENIFGSGIKSPTLTEIANSKVVRKSIVSSQPIKAGDVFDEQNLTTKRPGTGISGMHWQEILGKTAKRDYKEDSLIDIEELAE